MLHLTCDEYLYDVKNPVYKPVIINLIDTGYMISNTGVLLDKKATRLVPSLNHKGYPIITLVYNHTRKTISVHRLVATAFIPNPENKPQVNHIDGNKQNNWYKNLEWCTAKENINHAVVNGLQNHQLGELSNHHRYTNDMIVKVCELLEERKYTNLAISATTGVDTYTVSKIKCKRDWVHISNMYNIPSVRQRQKGDLPTSSKYTTDQISEVCNLIVNTNLTNDEISNITGVLSGMIWRIRHGLSWKHISAKFGIL